jgi:hypothetical protein
MPTELVGGVNVPIVPEPGALPLATVRPGLAAEPPLLAAMRAFIDGRQERAFEHILALDKPNQDLVLALLPVLSRGAMTDLANDAVAVAKLVDQLRLAAEQLEPKAVLRVQALFCRTVWAFGRYDPWPKNQPYRPNEHAHLYLEVRNLVSQAAVGPRGESYLTHARVSVEIRDAYDNPVPRRDLEDYRRWVNVVHFDKKIPSRTPIQDFHVIYSFPVPATPGVYKVTIEVRDATDSTGLRAVKTPPIEFTVAGP